MEEGRLWFVLGRMYMGAMVQAVGDRNKQQVHDTDEDDWNCGCSYDDAEKGFGAGTVWSTRKRRCGIC